MPKIIFEINYNIHPEKREEYLQTIDDLKRSISETSECDYSVYENKKNSNNFIEVFTCGSEEEFDEIEDNQSEEAVELTQRLFEDFIKDKKVTYTTMYEIL